MSHTASNHGHDHGHSSDHSDSKPHGFLNTVFDSTMGGFGILWVSIMLSCIFLIMLLG